MLMAKSRRDKMSALTSSLVSMGLNLPKVKPQFKDAIKTLKNTEKALQTIKHLARTPTSIKNIHKWQRRVDKYIRHMNKYLDSDRLLMKYLIEAIDLAHKKEDLLAKIVLIVFKMSPTVTKKQVKYVLDRINITP